MAGTTDPTRQDDETSSTASFEEVDGGSAPVTKALVVSSGQESIPEDEPVPDVLYVVQSLDSKGNIVNTQKSDKPFDLSDENEAEENQKAKPVIEILTKVSSSVKKGRRGVPGPPPPLRPGRTVVYSSSSESEDDDEMNVTKVHTTEMIIHSDPLKKALGAVVGYYPGVHFDRRHVSIPAPYGVLLFHREALARYRTSQPAYHEPDQVAETARHIDVLLKFLEDTYGARLREEEARHRRNPPATTFEWLWLLFKPGEVLYRRGTKTNRWTPYVISNVGFRDNRFSGEHVYITVDCWHLRWCNGAIRRVMRTIETHHFAGEQAIRSLPVIPAAFFPVEFESLQAPLEGTSFASGNFGSVAAKQVALGRAYWELSKRPVYKEYEGELVNRLGENGLSGQLSGRVVVDAAGFDRFRNQGPGSMQEDFRPGPHRKAPPPVRLGPPIPPRDHLPYFGPRCLCDACVRQQLEDMPGPFANFDDLDPTKDDPPDNELFFLVMAKDIPGFVLGERRWGHLAVETLKEVKPDREAFKHLVLDDEVKLTVKSLIGKFASTDGKVTPWPRDLIKNKGEGRIFLLHGSPGVGKTATCEAAAELGQRPLLCLTSGDISTSMVSSEVEANLKYFLQLGERYGALVLLDEADVYLEQRRTKDLARNGLVSIFLRALEYYKGVLFLTTNRVEAFDSAFTSRIHVALHYRRLSDEDRRRVWDNHFDRLERDSAGRVYVGMATREYVHSSLDIRALRLNGRQIKNALQVAVALAESEAAEDGVPEVVRVTVADRHIRAVVKMNKGFKDFMRRRRGWADESDDGENDADRETESDEDDDEDAE